jgi:hypothetical protein
MQNFSIIPHTGIGPILLGMPQAKVREIMSALGMPLSSGDDYFCNNAIQVEYTDGTVSFIGVYSEPESFEITYNGVNVFDTKSKELFALINKNEPKSQAYDEDECLFESQIITLYEADKQYDYYQNGKRAIYSQVGLGDARYLKAVSDM